MGKQNQFIKGFTLAELMAVIVILGIIMVLTIPTVDKTIKNTKKTAYNEQMNVISNAASDWILLNNRILPDKEGNSILIYLGQLKSAGLVEINIKNPDSGSILSNNTSITITKTGSGYKYNINLVDIDGVEDNNSPTLVIEGELVDYVEVNQDGTAYILPNALAYTSTGASIESTYISRQIIKNDVEVASVDTSKMGSYIIKYNVTYEGKTGVYEKKVIVRDTTVPNITFANNIKIKPSKIAELNLNDGVTINDNSGELLTPIIKSQISNIEGNYYAFYTVTDSSGNSITKRREVTIVDWKEVIGTTVLGAFPYLELGTNGCKNEINNKNYSYMGGCYIQSGINILAAFKEYIKQYNPTEGQIASLFNADGTFNNDQYLNTFKQKIADSVGCTVAELESLAASEGKTILELDFGYSVKDINENHQEISNYVWYSGFIWRIMGINSDGSIRLISTENISTLSFSSGGYTFENSNADNWLNDYFYNKLKGNNIVVEQDFCQKQISLDEWRVLPNKDCTGGTTIKRKAGLISVDEFYLANDSNSYLNIQQHTYTMSLDATPSILIITHGSSYETGNAGTEIGGVRPIINVSSSAVITGGNGSLNGGWTENSFPYILNERKNIEVIGNLKDKVTSGEYVKFANKTYRVVGVDGNGKTKLILDDYYQKTVGTYYLSSFSDSSTSIFSSSTGLGLKLNNEILNVLAPTDTDKSKLDLSYGWYQNTIRFGSLYTESLNESVTPIVSGVGLIRISEMLASQSYTTLTKNLTQKPIYKNTQTYWSLAPANSNMSWFIDVNGGTNQDYPSVQKALRPVIVINSSVTITSGNGTPFNPYEI